MPAALAHAQFLHKSVGFTLPELLWTLAILGLVLVAGIPSLSALINRYEAESSFRSFRNIVSYARAEAIVRKADVVLCPRKLNTQECYGDIDSDNEAEIAWKQGWLLFVDRSDSETSIDSDDLLLKVYEPLGQKISLDVGQRDFIKFMSLGNSFPSSFSTLFCLKDDENVNFAGKIVISHGRVRMEDTATSIGECDAL